MATTAPRHDVKDLALAPHGVTRVEWADRQMPVLTAIRERFAQATLARVRVAACLHVTTETANLARTLKAGGAEIVLCASNRSRRRTTSQRPLVQEYEIPVFAIRGEDNDTSILTHHCRRRLWAASDHGRRRGRRRGSP